MGGHAYWYFTPYLSDLNAALKTLQQQEFEAGRYNPVNPFPFDPGLNEICKSKDDRLVKYSSIEKALKASGQDGTRSILDMCEGVSDELGTCKVSPYPTKYLLKGTSKNRTFSEIIVAESPNLSLRISHFFEFLEVP